ncbi:MAG: hypothetical protein IPP47_18505 [Bryobacterales bacterium]|nr:hypothetical protein [Bryobacterales bacterium]
MNSVQLKAGPSRATRQGNKLRRPTLVEQARQMLQLLLLMAAVLGALWWIDRAAGG